MPQTCSVDTVVTAAVIASMAASAGGRGGRALQAEVEGMRKGGLPFTVVSLGEQVRRAPTEWLGEDVAAGEAWYVEALVQGSDSFYRNKYRVVVTVSETYGDGVTWPGARVLDSLRHVTLSEEFGIILPEALRHLAPTKSIPSLQAALGAVSGMLRATPPEGVRGTQDVCDQPDLRREWEVEAMQNKRREEVITQYSERCVNKGLFDGSVDIDKEVLDPQLAEAMKSWRGGDGGAAFMSLMKEEIPGVYSFPMFQPSFCAGLIKELEGFEASGLPLRRPNSMNNYGVIVNEIGMEGFMTRLQKEVTQPIGALLFPEEGKWLDNHHSFSVRYAAGEDMGLDMHTDDSDVTFNVCLGKEGFTGAGLTFCGVMGTPLHRVFQHNYKHVLGRCVVHMGRQRHGADDISEGVRINLIMWNRSLAFRRRPTPPYQKEAVPPSPQCLSYTHDKDYSRYKLIPPGKERFARGWCPPPGREHSET